MDVDADGLADVLSKYVMANLVSQSQEPVLDAAQSKRLANLIMRLLEQSRVETA